MCLRYLFTPENYSWVPLYILCLVYYFYKYPGVEKEEGNSEISSCKNPNCIRCLRYGHVQQKAKSRLAWILWDFKTRKYRSNFSSLNRRIPNAIQGQHDETLLPKNSGSNKKTSLQDPTVLMVSNLLSREIVTDWHRCAFEYLTQQPNRVIIFEVLQHLGLDGDGSFSRNWTANDSPKGEWKVFHILNQGLWNPILLSAANDNNENTNNNNNYNMSYRKKLLDLVRHIPGLLENCLFGNVYISRIYPGTTIEPHFGPTNIRHRLQFLLKMPGSLESSSSSLSNLNNFGSCNSTLFLSVGDKKIPYGLHNDIFVFDDSFLHSVTYLDELKRKTDFIDFNEAEQARIVLIIDLWHPDLQDMERTLLQELYPPFSQVNNKIS
mmetsp:Transcript_48754/g.54558  ORF Transcript_48754/g.54558 Transcript_48754/m.54558 type:complete len:379 (-) Transcript_48754:40-1176(-)